ncbi:MAG: glucose-6-phosphate dehydrogenase assembly protein OpcA [Verrucomicrobia bacterium]|nr:glucose-6-phosphate dehydrogenase assembly protein OpcA [Verrucomicrobiota bacterium]
MKPTGEQANIGAPVELDSIERDLKKLWADGNGALTRASLINLAVYSEEPGSLAGNTQLISRIMENHACRVLVIETNPLAASDHAQAWINAHCHVRAGAKQICSEQLSFKLDGTKLLTSVLFSHLDSDLPLYLWWQAELRSPLDPQLWTWVDRLIFDSREWPDFTSQLQLVYAAQREAAPREMVLCDLNWTRVLHFRYAFAQFFDDPVSRRCLHEIEQLTVVCGDGYRSTALLFVGWIAAQLEWNVVGETAPLAFLNQSRRRVEVRISEEGSAPLASLRARTRDVEFNVRRAECGDLLEVAGAATGVQSEHQLLPGGDCDLASLVSEELMRGGVRVVYRRAVEKIQRFLR